MAGVGKQTVENFLQENQVHAEWGEAILKDPLALDALNKSIRNLDKLMKPWCPHKTWILRALRLTPLRGIKGIIMMNDPVPDPNIATGVAASCNEYNRTIEEMKKTYVEAGLEGPEDYDYNYDHWAKGGILMLNARLTVTTTYNRDEQEDHSFWEDFTTRIVALAVEKNPDIEFGLFSGMFARKVFFRLPHDIRKRGDFKKCDHPIRPDEYGDINNNFQEVAYDLFFRHKTAFSNRE